MRVTYKGKIEDFKQYMDTLILIYGKDAKIIDIEQSIDMVRRKEA